MDDVEKTPVDPLKKIKKNIETSNNYYLENYKRFNMFVKFVFETSLTPNDIEILKDLGKPQLEFNILEAYISRLRGEFATQVPSIMVEPKGQNKVDPKLLEVVEGHIRYLINESNKNDLEYDTYSDLLAGGFSSIKVYTDYASEMSFDQNIIIDKCFDPTLVGYDVLTKNKNKSDANYCFEIYPQHLEDLKQEHPDYDATQVKFSRDNVGGFQWFYRNNDQDIVLRCIYYEKKRKKVRILKLATGETMTSAEYRELLEKWQMEGRLEQPPAIVGERMTEKTTIIRYDIVGNKILNKEVTDYKSLPLIFVDGNSVMIRDDDNGSVRQVTRPYVYHAMGVQKLKNFAGQTLANELENMVMHKWKVAKESIPPQYEDAYVNNQVPNILVYNAFKDDDPNVPVPPPQEVSRQPAPPEVTNTFRMTDEISQTILGSFDVSMGKMNRNDISGLAVIEATTQSNSAAMPYVEGFLNGLTRAAQIVVELMPKYYLLPRSIPIVNKEGEKEYVLVNQPGGIPLKFDPDDLEVSVTAGVNFNVQKNRALQQLGQLMSASPLFSQFINTEGLSFLLDNIDMRGADLLREKAEEFMQNLKQQQAQQQQQAQNMPNPEMLRMQSEMQKNQLAQQKMQMEQQKMQLDAGMQTQEMQLRQAEILMQQEANETDKNKLMAELQESQQNNLVQMEKARTERMVHSANLSLKQADLAHKHRMESYHFASKLKDKYK